MCIAQVFDRNYLVSFVGWSRHYYRWVASAELRPTTSVAPESEGGMTIYFISHKNVNVNSFFLMNVFFALKGSKLFIIIYYSVVMHCGTHDQQRLSQA